jgi:hypothetical protein
MEVIANRYYHNCSSGDDKIYANKKTKNEFVRFIMRTPPEHHDILKTIFSECCVKGTPINFLQRTEKTDRDKVGEFEFDVIPYDNSLAKDVVAFHSVIICPRGHEEEVIQLIEGAVGEKQVNFERKHYPKSDKLSYTTQLYPPAKRGDWTTIENPKPKYPICVLSFKRANDCGRSHRTLTELKLHHKLFVEPSQEQDYLNWFDDSYCELVVCPEDFSKQTMGSTPVRNFILDWGLEQGIDRVWMLDDNIKGYNRLYQGVKCKIVSSVIFTHIEDYIQRYDNVGAVSHNYNPLVNESDRRACIVKNGKCYSSMLLKTDPEVRFRYKHQEDNLISLEYIHLGYTNLCFNSVCYDKHTSGKDKGGNKEGVYKCKDGKEDGEGYRERFEYFEAIVKILFWENKINLIEGRKIEDLVTRSKRHKSHEFHADVNYEIIKNHPINETTKKENYEEIKSSQNREINWLFGGTPL